LEGILINTQQIMGYAWGEVVSIHRGLVRIEHTIDGRPTATAQGIWPLQHSLPIKRMAAAERGYLIADTLASPDWTPVEGMGWIRSFLGMPIVIDEEIIGFINLASDQPNAFTDVHAQRLEAVSGQAAIAIRNAKAYQQAQSLGVLAERQRLARELHDSVSQTVFAATTMAELLPHVRHDAEKLDRYIDEVALLTSSAMAEMRTLMIELQPDAITGTEFTALLKTLCDAFSGTARIPVELTTSGRIFLEPKVQTVFYRIAQEAISNIRRHAHASKVSLHFEQNGAQSELRISDNGCGFDALAANSAGRGILLMREQTATIGAGLEIRSQPDAGTDIVLIGG
jgi:signal transduction histidine kinase